MRSSTSPARTFGAEPSDRAGYAHERQGNTRARVRRPLRGCRRRRLSSGDETGLAGVGLGGDVGADRLAGALHETHSSFKGRILGTLLGIAVTSLVSAVGSRTQMAVAVALVAFLCACLRRSARPCWRA